MSAGAATANNRRFCSGTGNTSSLGSFLNNDDTRSETAITPGKATKSTSLASHLGEVSAVADSTTKAPQRTAPYGQNAGGHMSDSSIGNMLGGSRDEVTSKHKANGATMSQQNTPRQQRNTGTASQLGDMLGGSTGQQYVS